MKVNTKMIFYQIEKSSEMTSTSEIKRCVDKTTSTLKIKVGVVLGCLENFPLYKDIRALYHQSSFEKYLKEVLNKDFIGQNITTKNQKILYDIFIGWYVTGISKYLKKGIFLSTLDSEDFTNNRKLPDLHSNPELEGKIYDEVYVLVNKFLVEHELIYTHGDRKSYLSLVRNKQKISYSEPSVKGPKA